MIAHPATDSATGYEGTSCCKAGRWDIEVTQADVFQSNGVIQVVDTVLMPK